MISINTIPDTLHATHATHTLSHIMQHSTIYADVLLTGAFITCISPKGRTVHPAPRASRNWFPFTSSFYLVFLPRPLSCLISISVPALSFPVFYYSNQAHVLFLFIFFPPCHFHHFIFLLASGVTDCLVFHCVFFPLDRILLATYVINKLQKYSNIQ